jgi:hypothetical protein
MFTEQRAIRDGRQELEEMQAQVLRERDTLTLQLRNAMQGLTEAEQRNRQASAVVQGESGQVQGMCLRLPRYT